MYYFFIAKQIRIRKNLVAEESTFLDIICNRHVISVEIKLSGYLDDFFMKGTIRL